MLLLILGFSAILSALLFGVRSGWTSYAPIGREQLDWSLSLLLFVRTSLPAIVQIVAGILLLVFSRPFGRLLASGLSGPVP